MVKRKLILSIFTVIICLIGNSCFNYIPNLGICENTVEKEVISPNEKYKAVIFDRGCGATVGFITAISIIPGNEKINNDTFEYILFAENVYRESTFKNGQEQYGNFNFDIKWINDEELLVLYTESKNLSKKESFKNIKIKYELISK